jgi:hypothetical protein
LRVFSSAFSSRKRQKTQGSSSKSLSLRYLKVHRRPCTSHTLQRDTWVGLSPNLHGCGSCLAAFPLQKGTGYRRHWDSCLPNGSLQGNDRWHRPSTFSACAMVRTSRWLVVLICAGHTSSLAQDTLGPQLRQVGWLRFGDGEHRGTKNRLAQTANFLHAPSGEGFNTQNGTAFQMFLGSSVWISMNFLQTSVVAIRIKQGPPKQIERSESFLLNVRWWRSPLSDTARWIHRDRWSYYVGYRYPIIIWIHET